MTEKGRDTTPSWNDPDDAPEWPDEAWNHAEIAAGDKMVRPASGTLTRRGRPPVGSETKQQVTLRLPRQVIDYFRATGGGWQTRISDVLEGYVAKGEKAE